MTALPAHIGKYEIVREIGQGGMGTVYLAFDPALERKVALKTLFRASWHDAEAKERFLREARSAARLQHPNIITIFELGEVDGAPFIAMEYLTGMELFDAVDQGRFASLDAKLHAVEQLCYGLGHAHRHGVIHRDIKPSNIIVLEDSTVKVVDFGIARFEGSTFATRSGEVLGTPSYMAPEQFTDEVIDLRVDVWAVGVILYELISGKRPFDASTVPSLIYRIVHEPMQPLTSSHHRLPDMLVQVVEKALAKDRRQRYSDLELLASDLVAIRAVIEGHDQDTEKLPPRQSTPQLPHTELLGIGDPSGAGRARPRTPILTGRTLARTDAFAEAGVFGEDIGLQIIAPTPDETTLAVGGIDGSLRLWALEDRMKIITLRSREHLRSGYSSLTTALAFSTEGAYLSAGHLDGKIYLWQLETGIEAETTLRHDTAVGGLAFSPDTQVLISGGKDATLKFWEVPAALEGEARRMMRRQPAEITTLVVDPDYRFVVTGHANRSIRLHEPGSGRLLATLHGQPNAPSAMALSPCGKLLATGGRDGAVRLFDIESRTVIRSFASHTKTISSLVFFPDGKRLASVAMGSCLVIVDLVTGIELSSLSGKADECFACLAIVNQGHRILCGLSDGRIRVWED